MLVLLEHLLPLRALQGCIARLLECLLAQVALLAFSALVAQPPQLNFRAALETIAHLVHLVINPALLANTVQHWDYPLGCHVCLVLHVQPWASLLLLKFAQLAITARLVVHLPP